MKFICISAFNRPELLQRTLESILQAGVDGWTVFVSLDHGAPKECEELCALYGRKMPLRAHGHGARLWCSLNGFVVCSQAISLGAEAILFMDDDILLSPDALTLCDWYLREPRDDNDAGIALCRKDGNDPSQPDLISAKDTWMGHLGQGWFFTRKMWFDFVLRHWWTYEPGMGTHDTYDWALCYMAQKLGKRILRPRFARAQHAGAVGFHGPGLGIFPESISTQRNCNYQIEP